ncbi:hypothetical protein Pmani_028956 [Petrolisthes manimaculis]|uniref:Uncharacterized protein n=1 Tax=Petrolisthes manimaculis TaxID=1843537 RepID=A0AAE1TXH5_9EUCA|nr:hypothetical protein Pmani_028956 [Petrolisthes manimaculis]
MLGWHVHNLITEECERLSQLVYAPAPSKHVNIKGQGQQQQQEAVMLYDALLVSQVKGLENGVLGLSSGGVEAVNRERDGGLH